MLMVVEPSFRTNSPRATKYGYARGPTVHFALLRSSRRVVQWTTKITRLRYSGIMVSGSGSLVTRRSTPLIISPNVPENCPAPAGYSGFQLVRRIRDLVQPHGPIKMFKAYLSIAEQSQLSKSTVLRSELQASGVSLTDTPHNSRKDVADKMMIGLLIVWT